jgi:hypothetical protein
MRFTKAAFLLVLLLPLGAASPSMLRAQSTFFGLSVGMSSHEALTKLRKPADALENVKPHGGKRILTDTCPLTFCKLPIRRSIGFDTTDRLKGIGLTYKTSADFVKEARDCAFTWLSNTYGPPSSEEKDGGATRDVWHLGKARLTLESKNYNPKDFFVLIYYYSDYSAASPE